MDEIQNLGNITKKQRKRLGITLVELAEISGASQSKRFVLVEIIFRGLFDG